ncbi:hypothetical protein BKA69DRAFT_1085794 [Paraphysoderma sedebokerense]|nr:hypothetical protein BKA69DRAFT_1085794 [Paraphysoderma sedebokerense]
MFEALCGTLNMKFYIFILLVTLTKVNSELLQNISVQVRQVSERNWPLLTLLGFARDDPASLNTCPDKVICKSSSNYIVKAGISSNKWTHETPVQIAFRTGHKFSYGLPLTVSLFRMERRTWENGVQVTADLLGIPKYIYEGSIVKRFQYLRDKEYSIEFTPPWFLEAGQYLLVFSYYQEDNEHWIILPNFVVPVSTIITIQNPSQSSPRSYLFSLLHQIWSNKRTASKTPPLNPDSIPTDTIRMMLNNIDNVIDICKFCSASKSISLSCNQIMLNGYIPPQHYDTPDRFIALGFQYLSVQETCKLSLIETYLQKLEFKYHSLPSTPHRHTISQPKANLTTLRSQYYPNLPFTYATLEIPYLYSLLIENQVIRYESVRTKIHSWFGDLALYQVKSTRRFKSPGVNGNVEPDLEVGVFGKEVKYLWGVMKSKEFNLKLAEKKSIDLRLQLSFLCGELSACVALSND